MAGRKKAKQRTNAEDIPISSFSDIAFLLNIYFILVTSLQQFSGFLTNIPSADKAPAGQQSEEMPTVKLHDGVLTLKQENLTLDQFRQKLVSYQLPKREGDKKVIIIEATGQVPYQQYFETMAAITKAGGIVGIVKEDE
jgi:biopolymer transport protein ExbD